jgi:biopolymer transport protein ExbD
MSDYNNQFRLIKSKPRSKKLGHRVDLTAMVSISFLLIVFFMVTVELSKPKTLELGMADDGGCGPDGIVCGRTFHRTITLLLDDDDKIISYFGLINYHEESPKTLHYGKDGIQKELMAKNYAIKNSDLRYSRRNNGLIVIIKPSKKSNYGNLVDVLDEMAITNIDTYAIINDFSAEEMELLASN